MIRFFVTSYLDQEVYQQGNGMGWTRMVHDYVDLPDYDLARALEVVRAKYAPHGVGVSRISMRPAVKQTRASYWRPEKNVTVPH
jgi:hypothetical protein